MYRFLSMPGASRAAPADFRALKTGHQHASACISVQITENAGVATGIARQAPWP
jgi:hypothetical protein